MTAIAARTLSQDEIDKKNAEFWNELCGSQLAKQLGITDNSPASLKKFDDWYFDFYPYLYRHIPFARMRGKRVMEVGLGYGTVSQKIAESGAHYHGLDIAAGPVSMAAHRCRLVGAKDAVVKQGSVLEAPYDSEFFDWVVAIGCLHHTGNLAKAIDEVHRVLKPGGEAMIMVYSAASYRQFHAEPMPTLKRKLLGPFAGYTPPVAEEAERGAYDKNVSGAAAPQTEFVTKSELRQLCRRFRRVRIASENIGAEGPFAKMDRNKACRMFGPFIGLDLYTRLVK
jgi:ubiquinone/menaquinone biosynthesis C-methylase UbiE